MHPSICDPAAAVLPGLLLHACSWMLLTPAAKRCLLLLSSAGLFPFFWVGSPIMSYACGLVLTVSKVQAGVSVDIRYGSLLKVDVSRSRIRHRDP